MFSRADAHLIAIPNSSLLRLTNDLRFASPGATAPALDAAQLIDAALKLWPEAQLASRVQLLTVS
jgi:hypothetical protein